MVYHYWLNHRFFRFYQFSSKVLPFSVSGPHVIDFLFYLSPSIRDSCSSFLFFYDLDTFDECWSFVK